MLQILHLLEFWLAEHVIQLKYSQVSDVEVSYIQTLGGFTFYAKAKPILQVKHSFRFEWVLQVRQLSWQISVVLQEEGGIVS